jgi:hypothetical protein
LWAGLLAGPVVWATLLETNYVLAYVSCEARHDWYLHAAVVVAVLIVALAGWLAWRSGPAEDDQRRSHPVTSATTESRSRWMSMAGVMLSAWFILVMLAMEIPILVLRTCQ